MAQAVLPFLADILQEQNVDTRFFTVVLYKPLKQNLVSCARIKNPRKVTRIGLSLVFGVKN